MMNKPLFSFFNLLVVCLGIVSCGTARKVVSVEPSKVNVVRSHLAVSDPMVLLNDLIQYPEYAETIEPYLYERSYRPFTYADLERFSQSAKNDVRASMFFDSLLVDRQASILASLAEEKDVVRVADFYKKNSREMPFLKSVLKDTYFSQVETMDYTGLKSLYFAFRGTDLEELVSPRYSAVRSDLLSRIMLELNPFFDKEQALLNRIDADLRKDCERYIEKGVRTVAVNLSERVDRSLFKRVFKRIDIDNYSVEEYADKLVAENIDQKYIRGLVEARLSSYIQSSTKMRMEYLKNYLDDASSCPDYYMAGGLGSGTGFNMVADASDARRIGNAKFFSEATSVVSTILDFTPVGWIGHVISGVSLYNDLTEGSKTAAMMDQLASSLYKTVATSVNDYLNSQISRVDEARETSRQNIIKMFNEDF